LDAGADVTPKRLGKGRLRQRDRESKPLSFCGPWKFGIIPLLKWGGIVPDKGPQRSASSGNILWATPRSGTGTTVEGPKHRRNLQPEDRRNVWIGPLHW